MAEFDYERDRSRHLYVATLLDLIEIRHRGGCDCRPCADLRTALIGWVQEHVAAAVPVRLVG